jgi:dTDP-4-amino-4,6-dideoxygalactose transaminase
MREQQPLIPLSDPLAENRALGHRLHSALLRVVESGWYIQGREGEHFEQEFGAWLGGVGCAGVANGTEALTLALWALGVGPGDRVLTVSHTAVATVAAIEQLGARVVFVDIDSRTRCMSIESLNRAPLEGVRAIVPVHLYGHPASMAQLMAFARAHNLVVVEDCAQAHGATIDGVAVGNFGDAAAFSFYPTKNLGALGDGGAVVSRNGDVVEKVKQLRQYGWRDRYISALPGMNSRLDEMQAAVLREKLPQLDLRNRRRIAIAQAYTEALASSGLTAPSSAAGVGHVYHLYVVESSRRQAFGEYMHAHGCATGIHYPQPVHTQPAYANRCESTDLTNTERLCQRIVTLPLYPELSDSQVEIVCTALRGWKES